ncbi:MAG: hypothetical protein IJ097_02355 [Bacilli bacterium]|nr:hypothetical protein [Bacilli bacterium]
MRKMNNKGFAISTLIYGLAIMGIMIVAILMATMAQTRSNTSSLSKSIEDELNRFSKTDTVFQATEGDMPTAQEYIVPETGWYKIELWGSQGGAAGGWGAYTSGIIELQEGETLYFYVPKHKTSGSGRETDVRIYKGAYNSEISYESRIMVAAGGGSESDSAGGTLYGYNDKMKSYGGSINIQEPNIDYGLTPATDTNNYSNGTLIGITKDYEPSDVHRDEQHLGVNIPSPLATNNGGDGFYPSAKANTGGASYIAGYAGAYGLDKGITTSSPCYQYYERTNIEDGNFTYGNLVKTYYFVNGIMLPGVNLANGKAKITKVLSKTENNQSLPRKNEKFNNIRYIKDCTSGSTPTIDNITWQKITAVKQGINVASGKTLTYSTEGSSKCATLDLQENHDLDEIAIFHKPVAGIDYNDNTIQVSNDGVNWQYIKNLGQNTTISETETKTGIRVSAYQPDATQTLPDIGNYYILPVLSENKVITNNTNSTSIDISTLNGSVKQKWSIEKITDSNINQGHDNEYKILNLSGYKALELSDLNKTNTTLIASNSFDNQNRNEKQIWHIIPVGNNTYIIETVVPTSSSNTGYILPQTNNSVSTRKNMIIVGKNNSTTARFKLIPID